MRATIACMKQIENTLHNTLFSNISLPPTLGIFCSSLHSMVSVLHHFIVAALINIYFAPCNLSYKTPCILTTILQCCLQTIAKNFGT